jgi:hypothetical protein
MLHKNILLCPSDISLYFRQGQQILKAIQALPGRIKPRLPVRRSQQAVNICDAKLGRYLKFGVSVFGCAVVVADTEGRDPHQVINAVAEHLRDVGLRPQLSFDKDRLVGLISLESGGGIAVVLTHPCLEAWLGELLGITSPPLVAI